MLFVGLVASVLVHVWLLRIPARPTAPAPAVIPAPDAPTVVPAPQPEPDPDPEPPAPAPTRVAAEPPPLERTFEADRTESTQRGDLVGDPEGRPQPILRIDWGNARQARTVLEAGGMQVVILDTRSAPPIITHQVALDEGAWQRQPYRPPAGTTRYSNRLRIVHDVPAFQEIRRRARPVGHERVAVLVPVDVEQKLETAQVEAAFQRGLTMQEISSFAGRFTVSEIGLAFEIVHVGGVR
jgi:hypothetical protein